MLRFYCECVVDGYCWPGCNWLISFIKHFSHCCSNQGAGIGAEMHPVMHGSLQIVSPATLAHSTITLANTVDLKTSFIDISDNLWLHSVCSTHNTYCSSEQDVSKSLTSSAAVIQSLVRTPSAVSLENHTVTSHCGICTLQPHFPFAWNMISLVFTQLSSATDYFSQSSHWCAQNWRYTIHSSLLAWSDTCYRQI